MADDDSNEYFWEILKQQYRYFGPFPEKLKQLLHPPELIIAILCIMNEVPHHQTQQFCRLVRRQVMKKDNDFIMKIMKLDWRDRPTATELLQDTWWINEDQVCRCVVV